MSKVILYQGPETLIVVVPAPSWTGTMEALAAKDVPAGKPFKIVDASTLPLDRTFRNAWIKEASPDVSFLTGSVSVDMTKAKEIWRRRIRERRAQKFIELDQQMLISLERTGNADPAVAAKKQRLRDAPADVRIDQATTPDELKSVWIEELA